MSRYISTIYSVPFFVSTLANHTYSKASNRSQTGDPIPLPSVYSNGTIWIPQIRKNYLIEAKIFLIACVSYLGYITARSYKLRSNSNLNFHVSSDFQLEDFCGFEREKTRQIRSGQKGRKTAKKDFDKRNYCLTKTRI